MSKRDTTPEGMRRRYRKILKERNQLVADTEHWNATHPTEKQISVIEMTEEIDALLLRISRAEHSGKSETPA